MAKVLNQRRAWFGQVISEYACQEKEGNTHRCGATKSEKKPLIALVLGLLIGVEYGFMGFAGGVLMLMVLTMLLGMDTKLAVGTSSLVMMLVALTDAVSHVAIGVHVELLPAVVMMLTGTVGAVCSSKFANKVSERVLNVSAGVVLLLVSVGSLVLSV